MENIQVFLKCHDFAEWARRLKPSEQQYEATVKAFQSLPDRIKRELQLVEDGDKIISYTDKKKVSSVSGKADYFTFTS